MSTDAISPLRQRMIEDMSARKLNPHTQRSHISSCKRFTAYLKRSPDTATADEIRLFQLHLAETGTSICNRNRIMTGLRFLFRVTLRRLDLAAEIYHNQRTPEDPAGDEPGRGQAPLGHGGESQGSRIARSRLRCRFARGRGGPAQGWRYRQRAEHHPHRAGQGAQRPPRHAVARDARSAAAMVEGATGSLRYGRAARAALVVPWPQARKADDDPAAQSSVSRDGCRGWHQEGSIIERAPSRLANGQPQEWQERMALRRVDNAISIMRYRSGSRGA